MRGDFKTLLRKFCLESSVLGLKYLYLYPDPLSRCFWTITLCLTVYMACLLSWLLHSRFLDMPTRISIENQHAPLYHVPFPAITLCSPSQITISAAKHFESTLIDGNQTIRIESILPKLLGFYQLFRDLGMKDFEYIQTLITINRYRTIDVMGLLPQSCDDFLKLCYFKRKKYPNCKGLFNPILTKHGMCCIFNSKYRYEKSRGNVRVTNFVPHKASAGGVNEILTVVADYEHENSFNGTLLLAGAIRAMFTDWSEFPADDETNLVHPHTESYHVIHPTYTYCSIDVTALPSKSRNCYFEDETHLQYFTKYHNSDCDLLCIVRELERRCHCTMIYVPHLRQSRACNITSIGCIAKAKITMNKLYNTAQCDCPRDCVAFHYGVHMDVGNLLALPHMIYNPYSDVQFKKSTSILHFFFQSSVYVKQKQETVMSLISLASNLGGVFGLCLGCSVISILEIFFYIYRAIRNKITNYLKYICKNKISYIN